MKAWDVCMAIGTLMAIVFVLFLAWHIHGEQVNCKDNSEQIHLVDSEQIHHAFNAGILCGALCEPNGLTQECMTTQCDYSWATTKGDHP